jgi:alginate O-acetyltransferase complex protein AlgI
MYFNSIAFALFLPIVWVLYWALSRSTLRAQNFLLIAASYVFYGWWDWRFLSLIALSTLLDFSIGKALAEDRSPLARKRLLWISLAGNLGMLGTLKYFDFFAISLADAFQGVGITIDPFTLGWVLPVGISFYTFQTLSYTIDAYRRDIAHTRDAVAFFAYVSFFPQLVAGPIERASQLLPQFLVPRTFDPAKAADGMRQILWGLFKKVVIADACAPLVDRIFEPGADWAASTLLWGAFLFAFQIYCDFSGYSDIAIGVGRLFGFELMRNFAFPYFSRDIAEFWRRWHISLNTWFRDYVYIPLGGSKGMVRIRIRNILAVFLLSGLWHGANWTYVAWGLINAVLFIPLVLLGRNRNNLGVVADGHLLPNVRELVGMAGTFGITLVAWVFFRAESIGHAVDFLRGMVSPSIFGLSKLFDGWLMAMIVVLLVVEWLQRTQQHALALAHVPAWLRRTAYGGVFMLIFFLGRFSGQDFIYFQF